MRLQPGQNFPPLVAEQLGGGSFSVPADLGDRWGVLLFYRGHW